MIIFHILLVFFDFDSKYFKDLHFLLVFDTIEAENSSKELLSISLSFLVFADLHYKQGMYASTVADLQAILDRAAEHKVDFILHAGDFCNDYPGSPETEREDVCPMIRSRAVQIK